MSRIEKAKSQKLTRREKGQVKDRMKNMLMFLPNMVKLLGKLLTDNRVLRALVKFSPDVLHITGLNDVSIIGAYLGWKMQIPIIGSWHTNIHEFAAHRLAKMFRFMPDSAVSTLTKFAERKILDGSVLYYKMPKVVLAPNQELVDLLGKGTNRKAFLMTRGVDTDVFSPDNRAVHDDVFRFGFVGRLRAEKKCAPSG